MRLRNNINTIRNILADAKRQAAEIRNTIGLGNFTIKDEDFFAIIDKCLENLKFGIQEDTLTFLAL